MKNFHRSKGVTLVELLVAIVISALVVGLASRLFMSGQREFLARVFETDRLSALVRMKGALHHALIGEVSRCESGRLYLTQDGAETELGAVLKARFPGADSLDFRCFELGGAGEKLVLWSGRFQPQLIEYRIALRTRKIVDHLQGSVLK